MIRPTLLFIFLLPFAINQPADAAVESVALKELKIPLDAYLVPIPLPQQCALEERGHYISSYEIAGADDTLAARRLKQVLDQLGLRAAATADLIVHLSVPQPINHPQPDNSEGYRLNVRTVEGRPHAQVIGNSLQGLSRGVETLRQLMIKHNGRVLLREAAITDWPVIRYRFVKRASGFWLDKALEYRLNGGSQQLGLNDKGVIIHKDKAIIRLGEAAASRGLSILGMVSMGNVYRGKDADIQRAVDQFKRLQKAGFTHLTIMNDDKLMYLDNAGRKRFASYVDAQIHYATQVSDQLGDQVELGFMPNFYYGKVFYPPYAKQFQGRLPDSMAFFWAGLHSPGPVVTREHLTSIRDQAGAKKLWFYTNWPQVGEPWFLPINLMAARDRDFGDGDLVELVTVSTSTVPEALPVSFITLADRMWNPKAYDAKRSMRCAAAQLVDVDSFEAFMALFTYTDSISKIAARDQHGPVYMDDDPKVRRNKIHEIATKLDALARAALKTPAAQRKDINRLLTTMVDAEPKLLKRLERDEAALTDLPPAKSAICGRAKEPIRTDGRFDESAWQSAVKLTNFTDLRGNKPAPHQTVARLLYDDKNLYVAIEAFETHISDLQLDEAVAADDARPIDAKPGGFLWWADSMEIFLDAGKDQCDVVQLILNPWGMKECFAFDSIAYGYYGIENKRRTDIKVTGTVRRAPDRWMIECAIPLSTLKAKSWDGTWGLSVSRNRRLRVGNGMKYSTWTPLAWGFQDAARFGELKFE